VLIDHDLSQVVVGKNTFTFDYAFSSDASQDQVYDKAIAKLVDGVFKGLLNSSILHCMSTLYKNARLIGTSTGSASSGALSGAYFSSVYIVALL